MANVPPESVFGSFDAPQDRSNSDRPEEFDPFGIGDTATQPSKHEAQGDTNKRPPAQLPPRMVVKYIVHEDISSSATNDILNEGCSDIFVSGNVQCQVNSSDALRNSPFMLLLRSSSEGDIAFKPNDAYTKVKKNGNRSFNIVKIPKSVLGFVPVGTYALNEPITHMPLLLERKVSRVGSAVQIAVQIRSKLDNPSDLSDLKISLSISPNLLGKSIEIVSGIGEYSQMKRCAFWKLPLLPKGQSFMVSVKGRVHDEVLSADTTGSAEPMAFPVMLRCTAKDQISTVSLQAAQVTGHPANVTFLTQARSLSLVHHLK